MTRTKKIPPIRKKKRENFGSMIESGVPQKTAARPPAEAPRFKREKSRVELVSPHSKECPWRRAKASWGGIREWPLGLPP